MPPREAFDDLDFDPGILLDHRYQIVALLGKGGMGRVFKAFQVHLDAPVALKELTVPDQATPEQNERAMRRFCREARLLTRLRHPNIPRVLDYFTEDSTCYLVMDYVEGQTLAARLGRGDLPPAERMLPLQETLDYASQLCSVLAYLHSQQPAVVFGDLKPSNVILTPDGRAVMVDFGIARHSASRSDTPPWQRGLGGVGPGDTTSDTQPLGTPGYAAPEQYEQGRCADPRRDIFALGVLLYEMVTGHLPPPFPFGFRPVHALNPALPLALEDVIERALRFDPAERFQTARQMQQALRAIGQQATLEEQSTEEMVVLLVRAAPRLIVPAPGTAAHRQPSLLRRSVLISAGTAGMLVLIALGLLIFGLSAGTQNLAQGNLGHPLAAAPTPTNTDTPQPTATPSPPPITPVPHKQPVSSKPGPVRSPHGRPTPTPQVTPSPTPTGTSTETPTPSPTGTPGLTPTPSTTPTPSPKAALVASPAPTVLHA
jgi:serine/threonine-protein kinase